MMVIQGTNNPIVPQIESDQIVASLKKRGRPVEYLMFPDEGHGQSKCDNILKSITSQVRFLKRYLQP
jgi:dipeptidyl aminopeptidase/acylaminoacyl peptidase